VVVLVCEGKNGKGMWMFVRKAERKGRVRWVDGEAVGSGYCGVVDLVGEVGWMFRSGAGVMRSGS
jgi:hypothetical protein